MSGGWEGSTRTLPPDWPSIRPPILDRDEHQCTWLLPLDDGGPYDYLAGLYAPHERCTTAARDVDHIGDPDDHSPDNLRSLCPHHHGQRSSKQGNAARWKYREKRAAEQHPGLL